MKHFRFYYFDVQFVFSPNTKESKDIQKNYQLCQEYEEDLTHNQYLLYLYKKTWLSSRVYIVDLNLIFGYI